jgi:thiamine-phosphate pyrophosphorylase
MAWQLRTLTREFQALFIMNDRPDLALLSEADGVHVGQDDVSVAQARRILGPQRLVGVSTHNLEQLQQAVIDGASYVGLGPTFTSSTKSFDSFAGLAYLREASQAASVPMFAIGGIDQTNVSQVLDAGVNRIAVSSAICGSTQPEQAARLLRAALATRPI